MLFIMFTKHLEGWDLPQIMAGLKSAGVEGADLCVRPGYPVNPENAPTELPKAAKQFADEGLCIPLITTPGDFTDPSVDYAESLYAAAGEAGVKLLKLGYWYMEDDGYWATLDRCRRKLEGFAKLSEKTGVKTLVHNHSGNTMGLNSAAAMQLMQGFDPAHVGVFTDPGHLSIVGEPIPLALDMVKEYMAAVALKDLIKKQFERDGKLVWQIDMMPLGMGFGDMDTLFTLLYKQGFPGPVSFHCEYHWMPPESVIDQCRIDVRFIRSRIAALGLG
jgi:sugar phosphate isomerase/epimerase